MVQEVIEKMGKQLAHNHALLNIAIKKDSRTMIEHFTDIIMGNIQILEAFVGNDYKIEYDTETNCYTTVTVCGREFEV